MKLTYRFLSLIIDHIFFTTSGRGMDSVPIISDNSGLSLTAFTPPFGVLALAVVEPSPFLAGVPLFFLEAFFQSSSESSGSELSARFFLPPTAPLPALRPLFFPGDFFPGLYDSSLPPSYIFTRNFKIFRQFIFDFPL